MPQWYEQVVTELARRNGRVSLPAQAADLARWVEAVPAGYRERTSPAAAAEDLRAVASVAEDRRRSGAARARGAGVGDQRLTVRPSRSDQPGAFRLVRYGERPVELTSFLPVVESFGLAVLEAVPHRLVAPDGLAVHLTDLGLRVVPAGALDPASDGERLVAAVVAALDGDSEVDSLNRLVVAARMDWREVALMRAYRRYRKQAGSPHSDQDLDDALAGYPGVARALLDYFTTRFDPSLGGGDPRARHPLEGAARDSVVAALSAVERFDDDYILRGYLALIDATVRTNWFKPGPRATTVLKFDSSLIPGLPAPRPALEAFVYTPAVEGVHLRAGRVARGGIRWSERSDDLRTEILGLAAAQVKKNAIIVPTGAKGGFVCRGGAPPAQVRAAYALFIGGLLDVTDNVVAGEVVPPRGVVRADGDDPYLVVAADKGTATFSDLANSISERAGFWLGDAFASGGSRGFDHKAMGITARGAWKAVERHFRQLGIDVARDPIRVAGVGDMSGDVFGNGMLMSRAIRLVAAFDHRHVFVDPDPDAEASFAERSRLATLPRSSWADYRREAISPGGGVWSRDTKRVELPAAARAALGVEEAAMSPPELISAILSAPVDLLWFGGVGTFVKAPTEADSDVGDRANDAVRVTSNQVRARVIAEGGNLGITQRARIRYSRRGGRINTDFIDNAAGVATSDREVNMKILLSLAIDEGRLRAGDRDALLESVTDDVAAAVLRQVDHSIGALDRALPHSAGDLDAYSALMEVLERGAQLDRSVEALPDGEELSVRRRAGAGLIRPELAVLLAYAKSDLVSQVVDSPLVDDPTVARLVQRYFPPAVVEPAGELVGRHRLYRELAATGLAADLIDHMGITWAHETAAELGRTLAEVAAAWWSAWVVLGAEEAFAALEAEAAVLSSDEEAAVHATLAGAVAGLARTYLATAPGSSAEQRIGRDAPLIGSLSPVTGWEGDKLVRSAGDWAERYRVGDVGVVHRATGRSPGEVAAAFAALDARGAAGELDRWISSLAPAGRWGRWQSRALRDDLADYGRRAVTAALEVDTGDDPETAVSAWLAAREARLAGLHGVRSPGEAAVTGEDALARAAMAVRFLTRDAPPDPGGALSWPDSS